MYKHINVKLERAIFSSFPFWKGYKPEKMESDNVLELWQGLGLADSYARAWSSARFLESTLCKTVVEPFGKQQSTFRLIVLSGKLICIASYSNVKHPYLVCVNFLSIRSAKTETCLILCYSLDHIFIQPCKNL
jgi:hypothetical protein